MEKIKELYLKYKEIINYVIFGGLTTVVNFITYFLIARIVGIDEVISNGIAWLVSVLFAYITNKIFVFESKKNGLKEVIKEMISFFLARILSGICCDVGTFALMVKVLNINDVVSKLVTQIMVIVMNYVLSKLVVFRKNNKVEEKQNGRKGREIIMKNINLYICFLILAIIVTIVFAVYYLHFFHASKLKLDISTLSEINEEIEITNVQEGKLFSKIEAKITKSEENLKDYINFANGPGKGHYINYTIILQKESGNYKIKTIVKENNENEIVIEGYAKNSLIEDESYQIGILQKDYENESKEEFYKYTLINK